MGVVWEVLQGITPSTTVSNMPPKRSATGASGSKAAKKAKPAPVATKKAAKAAKVKVPLVKPKKALRVQTKTINHSICVPTTVLSHCKNLEQLTHVVYQIAKAAVTFNVGEVVVLDLGDRKEKAKDDKESKGATHRLSDAMLIATLLQYFVTPPYLVKSVFKKQYAQYFKIAKDLPRLGALPFMRHLGDGDEGRYREGLAVRMSNPNEKSTKEFKQTKYINVGRSELLALKTQLVPANVRVTVDIEERRVVSPVEAYGDFVGARSSFGYHVRVAKSFGDVFTESAQPGGYSQCVWANCGDFYYDEHERRHVKVETKVPRVTTIYQPAAAAAAEAAEHVATGGKPAAVQPANILLVFGKWADIQRAFNGSRDQFEGCEGAHQFFDGQLEMPGAAPQGCLAIEDACMVSLTLIDTLEQKQ